MGIELAHSEGQFVIHFLWDMRKFYDVSASFDPAAGGQRLSA